MSNAIVKKHQEYVVTSRKRSRSNGWRLPRRTGGGDNLRGHLKEWNSRTYSFTKFTLASTVFCAMPPSVRVSLVVWKNCWCHAAADPSAITTWLAKRLAMNCSRSCSLCRAILPAWFRSCGVKGGITTGGGGGGRKTPSTGWLLSRGAAVFHVRINYVIYEWIIATITYVAVASSEDSRRLFRFRLIGKAASSILVRRHRR